jgi:hypothetical protein
MGFNRVLLFKTVKSLSLKESSEKSFEIKGYSQRIQIKRQFAAVLIVS